VNIIKELQVLGLLLLLPTCLVCMGNGLLDKRENLLDRTERVKTTAKSDALQKVEALLTTAFRAPGTSLARLTFTKALSSLLREAAKIGCLALVLRNFNDIRLTSIILTFAPTIIDYVFMYTPDKFLSTLLTIEKYVEQLTAEQKKNVLHLFEKKLYDLQSKLYAQHSIDRNTWLFFFNVLPLFIDIPLALGIAVVLVSPILTASKVMRHSSVVTPQQLRSQHIITIGCLIAASLMLIADIPLIMAHACDKDPIFEQTTVVNRILHSLQQENSKIQSNHQGNPRTVEEIKEYFSTLEEA
jgi:hypothetical protein